MSKKSKETKSDHFIYCGNRDCEHRECLRHNVNTPWNVLIYRSNFTIDKNGNCNDMVLLERNI